MIIPIYTAVICFLVGLLFNKFYFELNKEKFVNQSKLVPNKKNIVGEAGVVFVICFILFSYINYSFDIIFIDWNKIPRFYSLFFGLFVLFLISFIDDKYDIPKRIRFISQVLVCYLSTSAINLDFTIFPYKIEIISIVFLWVYIINISNFIDGLNGFLSINILFFLAGSLLIIDNYGLKNDIIFLIVILAFPLILSFLLFNFPDPKLFFGDSGSVPVGFLIGYIIIYFFSLNIYIPALFLFLYPIMDVTLTLIKKVLILKKAPWERLFDYYFLKPVINKKKSHQFVFIRILITNSANLILLFFYLNSKNVLLLLLSIFVNIITLFYFSSFSKKA